MSKIERQELTRALEGATAFHLSEETREAHLDAISRAIAVAPTPPPMTTPAMTLRRKLTGVAIVVTTLAGPTAVALAAQGSLPNSTLYPVKRLTERVEALFDPSAPAQHRVNELSELIDKAAPEEQITEAFTAAESAVEASDSSELTLTLDELRKKVEAEGGESEAGDDTTQTTAPAESDDSVTTTAVSSDDDTSVTPSTTAPTDDTHDQSGDESDSSDGHSSSEDGEG